MIASKLLLLSIVFLTACATTEPTIRVVTQRVEIPIEVPCKAEVPVKPNFAFNELKEEDDIFEKIKALLADRKLHEGYETELLAALKSCKD